MAIGFEECFGFEYDKLQEIVSEPLNDKLSIANKEIIDLSIEVCKTPAIEED